MTRPFWMRNADDVVVGVLESLSRKTTSTTAPEASAVKQRHLSRRTTPSPLTNTLLLAMMVFFCFDIEFRVESRFRRSPSRRHRRSGSQRTWAPPS